MISGIPRERIRSRRPNPATQDRPPDSRSKALLFLEYVAPHLEAMSRMMDGIDATFNQDFDDPYFAAKLLGSFNTWRDWIAVRDRDRPHFISCGDSALRQCRIHMRIERGRRRTRPRHDVTSEQSALTERLSRTADILEAFLAYWRVIEDFVRKIQRDDELAAWAEELRRDAFARASGRFLGTSLSLRRTPSWSAHAAERPAAGDWAALRGLEGEAVVRRRAAEALEQFGPDLTLMEQANDRIRILLQSGSRDDPESRAGIRRVLQDLPERLREFGPGEGAGAACDAIGAAMSLAHLEGGRMFIGEDDGRTPAEDHAALYKRLTSAMTTMERFRWNCGLVRGRDRTLGAVGRSGGMAEPGMPGLPARPSTVSSR